MDAYFANQTPPPAGQFCGMDGPPLDPRLVEVLMRLQWEEDDGAETPKISADAKKLLAEYLRFWVTEALERASMQAQINDDEKVEPTHIENMLAGLLLDF